jgi:hypothetical protein
VTSLGMHERGILIPFLVANPIIAALIWAAMYIFDYTATLWFSRLYHNNPDRHFTYEGGVEMNPVFEKDIASMRWVSPRFLLLLCLLTALLVFLGRLDPAGENFEFVLGAFLLLWTFMDLRHIRNIYFYLHLRLRPGSMDGQIKQSYWLGQRLISYDAFASGLVYGLGWLVSARPFFAGGALVCTLLAVRHFFLANRTPGVKA